jgi:TRAP-type C4-dicarboxylate transport system substrate-binding protein
MNSKHFNKLQNETKEIIEKEINEIKEMVKDMKEEFGKDMESVKKKN